LLSHNSVSFIKGAISGALFNNVPAKSKKGCIVSLMAQFYRPEISSAFRVEIVGVDHALNRNLVRILADQIISKNLGILETSRS